MNKKELNVLLYINVNTHFIWCIVCRIISERQCKFIFQGKYKTDYPKFIFNLSKIYPNIIFNLGKIYLHFIFNLSKIYPNFIFNLCKIYPNFNFYLDKIYHNFISNLGKIYHNFMFTLSEGKIYIDWVVYWYVILYILCFWKKWYTNIFFTHIWLSNLSTLR